MSQIRWYGDCTTGRIVTAVLWVVIAAPSCHGAPNQLPVTNVGDTFRTLMLGWQNSASQIRSLEGYFATLTFNSSAVDPSRAALASLQFYAWARTPTGPAWVEESRWAYAGKPAFSPPEGLGAYREGIVAVPPEGARKGLWVLRPRPNKKGPNEQDMTLTWLLQPGPDQDQWIRDRVETVSVVSDTVDHHECFCCQMRSKPLEEQATFTASLWIDQAVGYRPRRSLTTWRFPKHGAELDVSLPTDFLELEPGVFLPQKAHSVRARRDAEGKWIWEEQRLIEIVAVSVNKPFSSPVQELLDSIAPDTPTTQVAYQPRTADEVVIELLPGKRTAEGRPGPREVSVKVLLEKLLTRLADGPPDAPFPIGTDFELPRLPGGVPVSSLTLGYASETPDRRNEETR